MRAIDATAHGTVDVDRGSADGAAPTAVPQRWQNLAPAVSDDRQAGQIAPSNGAPHDEQNRPPVDGVEQTGHVMGQNYNAGNMGR
jgi:hypothetical protein